MDSFKIEELENRLGYIFNDKNLLEKALTHSSYANERNVNKTECNERLEFLGDAVLEIISSDFLFKNNPDIPEGVLSKMRAFLVCEPSLYKCSKAFELGKYIMLGKGEDACGGRDKPSVVSDAFEAVLGAVYLDGGLDEASKIIYKFILTDNQLLEAKMEDSKSMLQQMVQAEKYKKNINYNVVSEEGPEHDKMFSVEVTLDGVRYGLGFGHNKKAAEKDAAKKAIEKLRNG